MAFIGTPLSVTTTTARTITTSHKEPCVSRRTKRVFLGESLKSPTTRHNVSLSVSSRPTPTTNMCTKANYDDQSPQEETVSLKDLKARLSSSSPQTKPDTAVIEEKQNVEEEKVEVEEDLRTEMEKENDRLRAAEKFIEVDEGKFECTGCGYVYDPKKGERYSNIAAGTQFEDIPESFTCPQCRTPKRRFVSQKKIIAGFADNQKYGFGSNTMTGGEKSLLIFGGLGLCFLLLLSGYALN